MRSPITGIAALFVLFVVLIVGYSSVFTVSQTEQVLVVRLGEPVRVVTEPGLNFKVPFVDTVIWDDAGNLYAGGAFQNTRPPFEGAVVRFPQSDWERTP